mgnify:CR=1 FL=1
MRFLATGDLHLGAGADLGREPGERLAEQEAVLARIVEIANELDATLIFAGDAWERRRPTPEELVAFRRPLEGVHGDHGYGLKRAGVVIAGNHDVEAFERATGYDAITTGRHWHLVSRPKVLGLGEAQIACLPWAPPGRLVTLQPGVERDEINRRLADGLVEIARGLFAETDPGRPRILVCHWSVSGASLPNGLDVELLREPVIPLEELAAIGFDAVVLGHIHKPQMLGPQEAPVFYVGSPMPLNFGEADSEHVVWILDVEPGSAQAYKLSIESRRLVTRDVDLTAHPDAEVDLGDVEAWALDAIVKLRIHAIPEQARRLDVGALKAALIAAGAYKIASVQVQVERAEVVRGVPIDETVGEADALERWLDALKIPDKGGVLRTRHAVYLQELAA